MSVDGKIGTRARTRVAISSSEDSARVDALRAACDAVLVGGVTLRHDDPRLTVKDPRHVKKRVSAGLPPQPLKVTVIGKLTSAMGKRFFRTGGCKVVFTTARTSARLARMLAGIADVRVVGKSKVDLRKAMRILRKEYKVRRLLLEGGATMNFEMLAAGCVDRLRVAVAPMVLGGEGMPTLVGGAGFDPKNPLRLRHRRSETVGGMIILHFDVVRRS
jgi:5-amino-6-(5-phosphoribosylamino)uracil reductase